MKCKMQVLNARFKFELEQIAWHAPQPLIKYNFLHPVPTKFILKLSPDMAILFAHFGCTHPPPTVLSFLFMHDTEVIVGSDITK